MAIQVFSDLYTSECEHCGADLEDWDWQEDDMVFATTCTCGTEYRLEPSMGVLSIDAGDILDDEDEDTELDE
jgi:hypothetical protein